VLILLFPFFLVLWLILGFCIFKFFAFILCKLVLSHLMHLTRLTFAAFVLHLDSFFLSLYFFCLLKQNIFLLLIYFFFFFYYSWVVLEKDLHSFLKTTSLITLPILYKYKVIDPCKSLLSHFFLVFYILTFSFCNNCILLQFL